MVATDHAGSYIYIIQAENICMVEQSLRDCPTMQAVALLRNIKKLVTNHAGS